MSQACGKCKRKPAFWHSPTLSYLCGGCTQEYRKRFRQELEADLRDRADRLSGPELALYWAAIVAAAALLWMALVLFLGLAP